MQAVTSALRRVIPAALVALAVAAAGAAVAPRPANAIATPYYCDEWGSTQRYVGDPLCKYAMAKGGYVVNQYGHYHIEALWARGGTASQECDPSNDVVQWAVDGSEGKGDAVSAFLYDQPSGSVFWLRYRTNYRSNCSVDATPQALWVFDVDQHLNNSYDLRFTAYYWHKIGSTSGSAPGFPSTIIVPIPEI